MSDYLSRTAERAEPGAAPAIRPRLASRYESVRESAPEMTMASEVEAPPAKPHHHEAVPASQAPFPREVEQKESAPRPAGPHASAPLPVLQPVAAPGSEWAASAEPIEVPQAMPASPHASAPAPSPQSAAPLLVERVVWHEKPPTTAPSVAKAAPPPAPGLDQVEPTELPEPIVIRQEVRIPGRTPAVPVPAPAAQRSAPLLEPARPALPPTAAPAPVAPPPAPTVNVTIGRLEIRAAVPAPERSRPQPKAKEAGPLPLDEFLRGKSPRSRLRT